MRKPSSYQLHQETSALFERVTVLSVKAKGHSKEAARLVDEAAGALAHALDVLKKDVDRRRALKENYERDLRHGR